MFKTYEGKMLLVFVGVLIGCMVMSIAVNPWARVQFFQSIGIGEWGYRYLTTLHEKIEIFNDRFSGPLWGTSTYSGFGLFYYGRELIWVISDDPFVLIAGTDRPPEDSRTNMERVNDNTLIFHSREYPITITFTRVEPGPGEEQDSGLVYFRAKAIRR